MACDFNLLPCGVQSFYLNTSVLLHRKRHLADWVLAMHPFAGGHEGDLVYILDNVGHTNPVMPFKLASLEIVTHSDLATLILNVVKSQARVGFGWVEVVID